MVTWMEIIVRDNKTGVLAGLDWQGNPMTPVTYRPIEPVRIRPRCEARARIRGWMRTTLAISRVRSTAPGTARRWRRGVFSRVITNLKTEMDSTERLQGRWDAYGYWDEVVARDGLFKFLNVHFLGLPLGKFGPSIQRHARGAT